MTSTSLQDFLDHVPEFQHEQQLRQLFAKFPNREDKPESWESKMSFWKITIIKACGIMDEVVVSSSQLTNIFRRNGLYPLDLKTVLDEMANSGMIEELTSYKRGHGWTPWLFSLFQRYTGISWNSQKENVDDVKYVILDSIRTKAKALKQQYQGQVVAVSDIEYKDKETLALVILNLWHAKEIHLFDPESSKPPSVTDNLHMLAIKFDKSPATEVDRGILAMKSTLRKLEIQTKKLESNIEQCTKQATYYHVQLKKKEEALVYLARRKRLQKILLQRLQSHDNISDILEKIDEAHTNKEILDAYQLGTSTLQLVMKQSGLTPEKVEDVMTQLSEVMADQKEIDDAIAANAPSFDGVDESELEKELEQMMQEEPSPSKVLSAQLEKLTVHSDEIKPPESQQSTSPKPVARKLQLELS